MKLTWVNHASFIVSQGNTKLMCDPWFEGPAFDNGWALLSEAVLPYEAFDQIDYIWFSHEHPDHFNPPNLKKIPEASRANITVLYQYTQDKKIIEHCKNVLGFKEVVEMTPGKLYDLGDGLKVMNEPWTEGDSWLYIEGDKKILNINDCIVTQPHEAETLLQKVGGSIDVLMTQFSYANWTGNTEDRQARLNEARGKLDNVLMQIEVMKPAQTIPFASYVWFCYEDNFFLNDGINTVQDCLPEIEALDTTPIVLYPGDEWEPGTSNDNTGALDSYAMDYSTVTEDNPDIRKPQKVSMDVLLEQGTAFVQKLLTNNNPWMIRSLPATYVWLEDHAKCLRLAANGFTEQNRERNGCDIAMHSDALSYCFLHLWGGDTINVNGRYQVPEMDYPRADRFWHYFFISRLNNRGISEPLNWKMMILAFVKWITGNKD